MDPDNYSHDYPLNKLDIIVDFLQMIFKTIIQNLQSSNTSSSERKVRGWWDFSRTKTRDTDVMLTPSFPHSAELYTPLNPMTITNTDPVAQRIRHLTTNQGIPGWNPSEVVFPFFFFL